MNRNVTMLVGVGGVVALAIGVGFWTGLLPHAQDADALTTEQQRSYALGMSQANGFRKNSYDVDLDLFTRGLKDALAGNKTLLTEEQSRVIVAALQTELKQKQLKRQREEARTLGEKNLSEGEAFLASNKASDGVVTLESGLQYKVIKAGDGKKPTVDDVVVVNYRGTLLDGTEFDSSKKRGPTSLPVSKVIQGWSDALRLMPVGSKWQLFIPPNLAYGERSMGRVIGPNATLVFDVELLGIKEASAQASKPETVALSEKPRRQATVRPTATQ